MEVYNFRKGSVLFDFTAYFTALTNATEDRLAELMKAGKAGSNFKIIEIIELKQVYPRIQVCATTNQPKSKTWIFVSVACGVVIIVLLVIIIFLVVSRLLWLQTQCLVLPCRSVTVLSLKCPMQFQLSLLNIAILNVKTI